MSGSLTYDEQQIMKLRGGAKSLVLLLMIITFTTMVINR